MGRWGCWHEGRRTPNADDPAGIRLWRRGCPRRDTAERHAGLRRGAARRPVESNSRRSPMAVRRRVTLSTGCAVIAAAVLAAQQQQPAPNPAQAKYPYPVVRDMRGVVPPGPKPLPSPPLGDGPWSFQTTEATIRVSIV